MASKKSSKIENNDMTMKLVVLAALVVAFVAGYFVARVKYKPQIVELSKMVNDKDVALLQMKFNANKIMMKEGKMWVFENGIAKEMDTEVTMSNGTKVMTDGKVIKSDGAILEMRNGDAMDMNGTMMLNDAAGTDINSK